MFYLNILKNAIEFLTIFKVGKTDEIEKKPENIASSLALFPIVGILLGIICALSYIILSYATNSKLVLSIFPVVILAIFTRGLHLDGVADCFDALHFASGNKKKALEVMKGKTIGAFGASALIIVIVGKIIAISALPEEIRLQSLILVPALSRGTSSIVASLGTPATNQGLGYIFTKYSSKKVFYISGVVALALSYLILGLQGVIMFFIISIFGAALAWYFNRAFGGVTGDVFGATLELSEVFGFLVAGVVFTL